MTLAQISRVGPIENRVIVFISLSLTHPLPCLTNNACIVIDYYMHGPVHLVTESFLVEYYTQHIIRTLVSWKIYVCFQL